MPPEPGCPCMTRPTQLSSRSMASIRIRRKPSFWRSSRRMTLPVLGISQAMGEQTRRQSHAVRDADSDENPAEIGPHRTAFQTQGSGDLFVLLPGKDQFDNAGLPWREAKRADQVMAL